MFLIDSQNLTVISDEIALIEVDNFGESAIT
jgi:hypothetical protein